MPIQFSTFRGAGNGGNLIECILRPAGQQCTLRPFAILNLWNSNSLTVGAVKRPILHQCTKFRKDRSNRCGDIAIFVIFQDCGRSHLGFSKIQNFNGWSGVRGHRDQGSCVVVLNFLKIGRTVADKWWFNFFFQNGGRPPSWICWELTGTTHDEHLAVFVVKPNLVKIDAVVSITWNFQYFSPLAWKRLFTPQNFGGISLPKMGSNINKTPKRHNCGS